MFWKSLGIVALQLVWGSREGLVGLVLLSKVDLRCSIIGHIWLLLESWNPQEGLNMPRDKKPYASKHASAIQSQIIHMKVL